MKLSSNTKRLVGITRSKAKMYEYEIPEKFHIEINDDPADLFFYTVSLLGDFAEIMANPDGREQELVKLKDELRVTGYFFDAYIESSLDTSIRADLLLLGATAYYLADMPGNSIVLAKKLNPADCTGSDSLKSLLYWSLMGNIEQELILVDRWERDVRTIKEMYINFVRTGELHQRFFRTLLFLRIKVYRNGSDQDILLVDALTSVLKSRFVSSPWTILPPSSGTLLEGWRSCLAKSSFIKELWPSQKRLAEAGVFSGASAVVQMPTSAGKTRAVELLIRASFIKGTARLVVLVAPFRSLCHEISMDYKRAFHGEDVFINELTDTFQESSEVGELLDDSKKQIAIVTPEKFLYLIRQSDELLKNLDLLVLDEGHQFDSGIRGVTYELLISQIKSALPAESQKVVISAVISNADVIGRWINGDKGLVVGADGLGSSYKSVAFLSWKRTMGMLQFVNPTNTNEGEFFVPRVVDSLSLTRLKGESKTIVKYFPKKDDGKTVALYLGLKLVKNGGVAVFCGKKDTAASISTIYLDLVKRNTPLPNPMDFSNQEELKKFENLFSENLGADSTEARCAALGIFNHHGSIPQGLRNCIEFAMRENLIKFVLCTSTLAQGVNLPIRYMIFTSIYQAGEKLRVRDFHNLIGRAGRAGMQTEGTILFADPDVYDDKEDREERWKWNQVKNLFDFANSEPCSSSILSVFNEIVNSREVKRREVLKVDILNLMDHCLNKEGFIEYFLKDIETKLKAKGFDRATVSKQLDYKLKIVSAIESYLMAMLKDIPKEERAENARKFARETLAYSLADEAKKKMLEDLFVIIAARIEDVVKDKKLKAYSKAMLGATQLIEIERWVDENLSDIIDASMGGEASMLQCLCPLICKYIDDNDFARCSPEEGKYLLIKGWCSGKSFIEICGELSSIGAHIKTLKQSRAFKLQSVVDICEGGISFSGMLVVAAVLEILNDRDGIPDTLIPDVLLSLIQSIKYGLESSAAVKIYEAGFNDRVVSQKLEKVVKIGKSKKKLKGEFKNKKDAVLKLLQSYPSYYCDVLNRITAD